MRRPLFDDRLHLKRSCGNPFIELLLVIAFTCVSMPLADAESVPLHMHGGTFVVPVTINGLITLDFTIDSGASDVSIPADVYSTLVRAGTVSPDDLMQTRAFTLADGSKQSSQVFRIRSLKIGTIELRDVTGSVAPTAGPLLLGQSFLVRMDSWAIDNQKHALIIGARVPHAADTPSAGAVKPAVNWTVVSKSGYFQSETFVDTNSIVASGPIRKSRTKKVYATDPAVATANAIDPADASVAPTIQTISSYSDSYTINCAKKSWTEDDGTLVYSDGKIETLAPNPHPEQLMPVTSSKSSDTADVVRFVCSWADPNTANWHTLVNDASAQTVLVNVGSIRLKGTIRRAWIQTLFARHTKRGINGDSRKWTNKSLALYMYDCDEQTFRIGSLLEYFDDGTMYSTPPGTISDSSPVPPDTIASVMMEFICTWNAM